MKKPALFNLFVLPICVLMAGCPADYEPLPTIVPEGAEAGRWIVLDGAPNTRDIGGYQTAQGKSVLYQTVYRSGTLSRLTSEGCEAFTQLGVRRVIDFRNRLAPSPLFDGDAPCVFAASKMSLLPVLADATDPPDERYMQAVIRYSNSYRQAFNLLVDVNNLPLPARTAPAS
jgi:protein-tyrosine phosphatase